MSRVLKKYYEITLGTNCVLAVCEDVCMCERLFNDYYHIPLVQYPEMLQAHFVDTVECNMFDALVSLWTREQWSKVNSDLCPLKEV